jgi:hypothetical protein
MVQATFRRYHPCALSSDRLLTLTHWFYPEIDTQNRCFAKLLLRPPMHFYGTVHFMHVFLMHHERNSFRLSGRAVRLIKYCEI